MTVRPVNAFNLVSDITASLNVREREEYSYYRVLSSISVALVDYRTSHHLSQGQLADRLGVSQAMVSKYESGDYNISVKALNHIAHQLGMDLTCALAAPQPFTSTASEGEEVFVSDNIENTY